MAEQYGMIVSEVRGKTPTFLVGTTDFKSFRISLTKVLKTMTVAEILEDFNVSLDSFPGKLQDLLSAYFEIHVLSFDRRIIAETSANDIDSVNGKLIKNFKPLFISQTGKTGNELKIANQIIEQEILNLGIKKVNADKNEFEFIANTPNEETTDNLNTDKATRFLEKYKPIYDIDLKKVGDQTMVRILRKTYALCLVAKWDDGFELIDNLLTLEYFLFGISSDPLYSKAEIEKMGCTLCDLLFARKYLARVSALKELRSLQGKAVTPVPAETADALADRSRMDQLKLRQKHWKLLKGVVPKVAAVLEKLNDVIAKQAAFDLLTTDRTTGLAALKALYETLAKAENSVKLPEEAQFTAETAAAKQTVLDLTGVAHADAQLAEGAELPSLKPDKLPAAATSTS